MQIHRLRILILPLIMLIIAGGVAAIRPATASPVLTPPISPAIQIQDDEITLDLSASNESVPLGQVVTYTVTIGNESDQPINAALTSELPPLPYGLSLQRGTVSATVGLAQADENSVVWSGEVDPQSEAMVTFEAIPPTTASSGESLESTIILEAGQVRKEASITLATEAPSLGWWGSFVNFIGKALVFFDVTLETVGIPYAFGFAIILFTLSVRLATFPLNMQQIKSAKGMQELQPKLKALQEKYKNDRENLAREQMALYKEHGVNPLGGCLPLLVQMPIWFALYQALIRLSSEGLLTQGFFWIPSLSGPVSTWGGGIDWFWPFPPSVGWPNALAYLVMPVLLVVSQIYTQKLMTPPATDPQQAQMQKIMKFMPIMFGYFALIVPSGLTLYWFTSNILGVAQHYFTKTQFDAKPAEASASLGASSPVTASSPTSASVSSSGATSEGNKTKRKNDRKRKSRRKR